MTDWKTTIIGIAKVAFALAFIVFKLAKNVTFTDAEVGLVVLALGGGAGNIAGADAKPKAAP